MEWEDSLKFFSKAKFKFNFHIPLTTLKKELINLIAHTKPWKTSKGVWKYSKKIRFTRETFMSLSLRHLKNFVYEFLRKDLCESCWALSTAPLLHIHTIYRPFESSLFRYEKKVFSFLILLDSYIAHFSSSPIRM